MKTEPLHIVEPTLTDATGHCYSFLDAFCSVSADHPITVWGGREAQVTFTPNVVVKRFFDRRIRKLQAWWLYRTLLRRPGRIFVSTAGRLDLMLLDWAAPGTIGSCKVFLYVHWFRASPSKLRHLSRLAARQPEVVILVPTPAVLEVFRSAGFRHAFLVPYPMASANDPPCQDVGTFRHILYAGAARWDKGFTQVVDFVQLLARRGADLPVKLQTSAQHYEKTDPSTAASLERLSAIAYPHLERFPSTLAPDEYAALFRGAVCLQLYARDDFADRVSGVTLDAFCNGSPIVTLGGTWMARMAQEFGAGEVLDEPTPEAILAAVLKLRTDYARYHDRAREAGDALRRRHDPGALFGAVTGASLQTDPKRDGRRPLSVVIIAKNEAERIEACLGSVAWADEIVVVDSDSTDATCAIARRYTDKVFAVPWRGFGPQKQAAVDLAAHDWVLNVDCDERVTPELAEEIKRLLSLDDPHSAYSVPRRTFLGKKEIRHCGWYPDRTIRLFDRTRARFSDSLVHEHVVTTGPVGECREHLMHYSFAGLVPLLDKLNLYSDLSARQMYENGRRCSPLDLTVRPAAAFVKIYFIRAGILDGVEGLTVAVSTAMLTFLKYAKLRELERR